MGVRWTAPEARRSWPRDKRRVEARRKAILLRVKVRFVWGAVEGATRSERVPVTRRAMVDVRATMETCVAGEFRDVGPGEGGG